MAGKFSFSKTFNTAVIFINRALAASAPIFQFTGLTPCEVSITGNPAWLEIVRLSSSICKWKLDFYKNRTVVIRSVKWMSHCLKAAHSLQMFYIHNFVRGNDHNENKANLITSNSKLYPSPQKEMQFYKISSKEKYSLLLEMLTPSIRELSFSHKLYKTWKTYYVLRVSHKEQKKLSNVIDVWENQSVPTSWNLKGRVCHPVSSNLSRVWIQTWCELCWSLGEKRSPSRHPLYQLVPMIGLRYTRLVATTHDNNEGTCG